jgi:hypothetical protein
LLLNLFKIFRVMSEMRQSFQFRVFESMDTQIQGALGSSATRAALQAVRTNEGGFSFGGET